MERATTKIVIGQIAVFIGSPSKSQTQRVKVERPIETFTRTLDNIAVYN